MKFRIGDAMRRMDEAGWTLCAPGDRTSPMRVDPTLVGHMIELETTLAPPSSRRGFSMLAPPAPPAPPRAPVPWAQVERYPLLHLGYVSAERLIRPVFGRVAGSLLFESEDGAHFDTGFTVLDVRCQPVIRVDIILVPGWHGSRTAVMWALSQVTWIKPTERLSWTAPCGAEYWVDQEETLGEVGTRVAPKEAAGLIEPHHGVPLNASHLVWAEGSWSGSLMLSS